MSMVEKVYGKLTASTLAQAIAKLPGAPVPVPDCHAGVTRPVQNGVTDGADGAASDLTRDSIPSLELENSSRQATGSKHRWKPPSPTRLVSGA
jgi:hypothetical protein